MIKVIKISQNNQCKFIEYNDKNNQILNTLIENKLAERKGDSVLLFSESGPIFFEDEESEIPKENNISNISNLLANTTDNSINLSSKEKLSFGKSKDCKSYNDFADLSLNDKEEENGIKISAKSIKPNTIVSTLWNGKRVIPAMIVLEGRNLNVELPFRMEKNQRCFILDEEAEALLTISLGSNGSDKVRILPPIALNSWLISVGSESGKKISDRFDITFIENMFKIADHKLNKVYFGRLNHEVGLGQNNEMRTLTMLLNNYGLGGILALRKLEIY